MKLNFWQWLGIILLILGLVLYYKKTRPQPAAHPTTSAVVPATATPTR